MQTSIIINTTDTNDKALNKTLTFVNAACSASVLKTAAQMLNGLTTNTYGKTTRIDKTNVDAATDKPSHDVTLTYSPDATSNNYVAIPDDGIITTAAIGSNNRIKFRVDDSTTEDALLRVAFNPSTGIFISNGNLTWLVGAHAFVFDVTLPDANPRDFTMTFSLAETPSFTAYSKVVTLHIVQGGE